MTPFDTHQHDLGLFVGVLIDQLVRAGVTHFCVCPGSRSTPLALVAAGHPDVRLWVHLDERSAGFFALGLAKSQGAPVALICTSGTAAANFLPAVVEAFYARVPLVVLTADRPRELRDCGAPQTIDQVGLFGSHARWFVDLPEPSGDPALLRSVRAAAARAAALAAGEPAGPVHLNCPYREPLLPAAVRLPEALASPVRVAAGQRTLERAALADLAAALEARRGVIVCGPQSDPALARTLPPLAAALGYPVLADPLSGLRGGAPADGLLLDCYDAFLRDPVLAERLEPELVLCFGSTPASKPLAQWLDRHPHAHGILVDGGAGWSDPAQRADTVVHANPARLCAALAALPLRPQEQRWAESWQRANTLARRAISEHFAVQEELFEGQVFAQLAELLPEDALLYVGNSMPVRDLDTFFPCRERPVSIMCNRGANGIDGVVSSALGAGAARGGPLVLVIGDVSFYHDSNGLLAARQYGLDATIVLLNNDGGGIFSFLAQAEVPEHFETLFGTPHGLAFEPLAQIYGARYTRVGGWADFRAALRNGIGQGGLHIIEVPTDRARNVAQHRAVWRAVAAALAPLREEPLQ